MYESEPVRAVQAADSDNLRAADVFPAALSLAMAYVPVQRFGSLYEPETGFERGTIYKQLDLPFLGKAVDA